MYAIRSYYAFHRPPFEITEDPVTGEVQLIEPHESGGAEEKAIADYLSQQTF